MKDFGVLGSGISGSTIAKLLSNKFSLEVFEKAKGIGGRASNRRYIKNLSFDHGAQYIHSKNKNFNKFISFLVSKKVLKKWSGNHLNSSFNKEKKKIKYIGIKGNNNISKFLLKKIKKNCSSKIININFNSNFWSITLQDGSQLSFKNLILTCPFPQVKDLANKYLNKNIRNLRVDMQPNITVMLAYNGNENISVSSFRFDDKMLEWAANENSKKRFKSKYKLWTIQTNEKWAKKYINNFKKNKSKITLKVINRFLKLTGLKKQSIVFSNIHGWKYSFNYKKTNLKSYWSKKYNLGICGDWFMGPKIEHAWLSANDLFKKINKKKPA